MAVRGSCPQKYTFLEVGATGSELLKLQKGALYNVQEGLRPANSYENGSELKYATARSGEVDNAMEKPRPI